jgi:hypothetical protein
MIIIEWFDFGMNIQSITRNEKLKKVSLEKSQGKRAKEKGKREGSGVSELEGALSTERV